MDSVVGSQQNNKPLVLEVGEIIKISLDSIQGQIQSNQFSSNVLDLGFGRLYITSSRVVFDSVEGRVQLNYQKVISHGIQDNILVCYLRSGEEQYLDQGEQELETLEKEEKEYFNFIIEQSRIDIVNIQGDLEIKFSFACKTLEDLKQSFNYFIECSALNSDEEEQNCVQQIGKNNNITDFDFDSMVTGKDIDENGNLVAGHPLLNDDEEEEDDEQEDGDEDNNFESDEINNEDNQNENSNSNDQIQQPKNENRMELE